MLAKVETDQRRSISARGLARVLDVDVSTVNALLNNRAVRVDLRVCEKALRYFHGKGYYYTMADLFTLEDEKKGESEHGET